PIVHANLEPVETKGDHQVVDYKGNLDVGRIAERADGVEVALHEFAEPSGLRALAAPDRAQMIALERQAGFGEMPHPEPGERDGQVETQRDVAIPRVLETVKLLVDLRPRLDFRQKDFGEFNGWRVDRGEAIGAEDLTGGLHEPLAGDH